MRKNERDRSAVFSLAANRDCGYPSPAHHWTGVAETSNSATNALSRGSRLLAGWLAAGLSALLALAAWLEPDPQGLGTHQQFGFPRCTFRVLFGLPCPTCGMTTAWAHLVRGELGSAFRVNAAGALLAGLAVAAVPWLAGSAIRGRWLGRPPNGNVVAWTATAICLIAFVQWGLRLLGG